MASRSRLPRGFALARLRVLAAWLRAPTKADRPDLRRRLPGGLHERTAVARGAALARCVEPRGPEPARRKTHGPANPYVDPRRLGDRRPYDQPPRPDHAWPGPASARGRRLACVHPPPLPRTGRLLLLPVGPIRLARPGRGARCRFPRRGDRGSTRGGAARRPSDPA